MIKRIKHLFLSTILFWSVVAAAKVPPVNDPEKVALVDLYNATGGGQWHDASNNNVIWNISALNDANLSLTDILPSQIKGVTVTGGHVTALNFVGISGVVGTIPSSISAFTELQTLNIPSRFLTGNNIHGVLPSEMSALTKLVTLNLPANDCSGEVTWLGSSSALTTVNLSSFDGGAKLTIRPTADFDALTNLTSLTLDNNEMTSVAGSPDNKVSGHFMSLTNLTHLSLQNCNLSASSFTAWIGGIPSLASLFLDSNPLITLPPELKNLTSLANLHLNSVQLQGVPTNLFVPLTKLVYLELNSNNLGTQTPPIFFNVVHELGLSPSLKTLMLRSNLIENLPSNFDDLGPLTKLDLSLNPIGPSLDGLGHSVINELILEACSLKTYLPSHLYELTALTTLDVGNSAFKLADYGGTFQNQFDLSRQDIQLVLTNSQLKVKKLIMSGQCLSGVLPNWFGTGYMATGLESLDISDNSITALPTDFSDPNKSIFTQLKIFNASNNPLGENATASIDIKALKNIEEIDLSNPSITDQTKLLHYTPNLSTLTTLKKIDLSNNQLGPGLAAYFNSLPNLQSLDISRNNFNEIPKFNQRPQLAMDLSYNQFDFQDLDDLLNRSGCGRVIASLTYDHQNSKVLGQPATFKVPERMQVELMFSAFANPTSMNNGYEYSWERFNGGFWTEVQSRRSVGSDGFARYMLFNAGPSNVGVYRTRIYNTCLPDLDATFFGQIVTVILIPPLCESDVPKNGSFKLDKLTGNIIFERADCPTTIPISCVFGPVGQLKNVVSASAVTLSDNWKYTYLGYAANPGNPFETGERGKWRQKASYTYSTNVDQSQDKNFNGGTYSYKAFNWQMPEKSNNPGWLKVSEVEKYSPHGDPVQERNAINIASTAKFGYNNTVPYLVAQNADYASVLFEGFESVAVLEDGVMFPVGLRDSDQRHSGSKSLKLVGAQTLNIRDFVATEQVKSNGLLIKVWTKGTVGTNLAIEAIDNAGTVLPNKVLDPQNALSVLTLLASSGEWSLYQVLVKYDFSGNSSYNKNDEPFRLRLTWSSSGTLWIDDLRIQPTNAEMSAYVYDPRTLKLLTVFDDQHFGMFYQYNAEGKLVRKIVETERGIRTVQETQYNIKKTTNKGSK